MKNFKMQKMVRDKVVGYIEERGNVVKTKTLNDKEFFEELKIKLLEEVKELGEVGMDDLENLKNELADVQEIVDYIIKTVNFSSQDMKKIQDDKMAKSGGFEKRIFVETVSLQDDDPWVETYRKKGFEEIK